MHAHFCMCIHIHTHIGARTHTHTDTDTDTHTHKPMHIHDSFDNKADSEMLWHFALYNYVCSGYMVFHKTLVRTASHLRHAVLHCKTFKRKKKDTHKCQMRATPRVFSLMQWHTCLVFITERSTLHLCIHTT